MKLGVQELCDRYQIKSRKSLYSRLDGLGITVRNPLVLKQYKRTIDLTDSLPDITANIIHDSEHFQFPSEIFENAILQAINDLIDDFSLASSFNL